MSNNTQNTVGVLGHRWSCYSCSCPRESGSALSCALIAHCCLSWRRFFAILGTISMCTRVTSVKCVCFLSGHSSILVPAFDPKMSPRNFVLISRKRWQFGRLAHGLMAKLCLDRRWYPVLVQCDSICRGAGLSTRWLWTLILNVIFETFVCSPSPHVYRFWPHPRCFLSWLIEYGDANGIQCISSLGKSITQ